MFSVKQSKFRWSDGLKLYDRNKVLRNVRDVSGAGEFFGDVFNLVRVESNSVSSYLSDEFDIYVGNPKFVPYLCYWDMGKSGVELGFVVKFNLYFDDLDSMTLFLDAGIDLGVGNRKLMGYMPSGLVFGDGVYYGKSGLVGGVSPVGFIDGSLSVNVDEFEVVGWFLFEDSVVGDGWLGGVIDDLVGVRF